MHHNAEKENTEMKLYRSLAAVLCLLATLLCVVGCAAEKQPAVQYPDMPELSTQLPAIHIDTADGSYEFAQKPVREDKLPGGPGIEYVAASVSVSNCDAEYVIDDAEAQVKARGNWTLNYPKKALRIKFAEKQGMLGLNEGRQFKNWLLLADWKDLSMTHNATALFLADALLAAEGYYVSDYMYVEVYINGHYWGVYLLAEQQEINEGRTSVPEAEKDYAGTDIGYFFEYDAYYRDERMLPDGDPTFEINYGLFDKYGTGKPNPDPYAAAGMHGYTMKSDIYSDAQLDFVADYVQNIYTIITEAIYNGEHYAFNEDRSGIVQVEGTSVKDTVAQVIELDSLVGMYILNEIVVNPDIAWSSFYLSLDMSEEGSKKLIFEAPWDFDSCFGIRASTPTTPGTESYEGQYVARTRNPWLCIFSDQEWFMDMVRAKWADIRDAGVTDDALALVEQYKVLYRNNFDANYRRWKDRVYYGNEELIPELNSFGFQHEAADFLTGWLTNRVAALDKEFAYSPEA